MANERKDGFAQDASGAWGQAPPGLYEELMEAVGKDRVSLDQAYRQEVAADAARVWGTPALRERAPAVPWAVVRPDTTEQVAAAVAVACRHRMPVVPYGGGSGLMGGAFSLRPGIVIDLRSLNRIRSIDGDSRTAWVEAGVVLKELSKVLEEGGFILGHDPWSLPVATVGGAISTNGLGYLAGRYGSMGQQVLGLTVVLPDGSILRTRGLPTQSVGIDLGRLFIGAEGTLGIITEAVLRIFPRPERRTVCAFSFPSFEAGFQAVLDMLAVGLQPSIADYGDRFPSPPGLEMPRRTTLVGEPPALYLVLDGLREEVEAQERRVRAICVARGGQDMGPEEADRFWRQRHDSGERFLANRAAGRGSDWSRLPSHIRYEYLTVVVPASRVLEYRQRALESVASHQVYPLETGFWGTPELFALFIVKIGRDAEEARTGMVRVTDELLMLAQDMGGAFEQCHGVGVRRAHLMERQHGSGLALMRRIKGLLDPYGIMNPGKLALGTDEAVPG